MRPIGLWFLVALPLFLVGTAHAQSHFPDISLGTPKSEALERAKEYGIITEKSTIVDGVEWFMSEKAEGDEGGFTWQVGIGFSGDRVSEVGLMVCFATERAKDTKTRVLYEKFLGMRANRIMPKSVWKETGRETTFIQYGDGELYVFREAEYPDFFYIGIFKETEFVEEVSRAGKDKVAKSLGI